MMQTVYQSMPHLVNGPVKPKKSAILDNTSIEKLYNDGMLLDRSKNYNEALNIFKQIYESVGEDSPYKLSSMFRLVY